MSDFIVNGSIWGNMAAHLLRRASDGKIGDPDKAVVLAAGTLTNLSDSDKSMLKSTFEAGNAIVVVNSGGDLSILHSILETGLNCRQNRDVQAYAIDMESNGDIWQATFYDAPRTMEFTSTKNKRRENGTIETTYSQPAIVDCVKVDIGETIAKDLLMWLAQSGSRDKTDLALSAKSSVAGDSTNELTNLAKKYIDSAIWYCADSTRKHVNSYQIHMFAYSCYSDHDQENWFLIEHFGVFSSSPMFIVATDRQNYWYATEYVCNSYVADYEGDPNSVALIQSSPATTTGETTTTSSVSYSVSGTASYSKSNGAGASVTGGMSISNSRSMSIKDVTIKNSVDKVNNAKWIFSMPKCTPVKDGCINTMHPPVLMSHSTFQPANQWIWKVSDALRNNGGIYISTNFAPTLVNSYMGKCNIFGCNCDIDVQQFKPSFAAHNTIVPFPYKNT